MMDIFCLAFSREKHGSSAQKNFKAITIYITNDCLRNFDVHIPSYFSPTSQKPNEKCPLKVVDLLSWPQNDSVFIKAEYRLTGPKLLMYCRRPPAVVKGGLFVAFPAEPRLGANHLVLPSGVQYLYDAPEHKTRCGIRTVI